MKKTEQVQYPKDALGRVVIGQAFAEYDLIRSNKYLFVNTSAITAAIEPSRTKSFFVGRRGTGKTAITFAIEQSSKKTMRIYPEIFSPLSDMLVGLDFKNTHQRPFRSLIVAFQRAILSEILKLWMKDTNTGERDLSESLQKEFDIIRDMDFDLCVMEFIKPLLSSLRSKDEANWLKEIKKYKELALEVKTKSSSPQGSYTIIIDRIDESWDGSDSAVNFLIALLHAALELSTLIEWTRVLIFIRENVFERVRATDSEFARLETCVVGLDWTQAQLLEMIERRLNLPFSTREQLGGKTWDHFFETGEKAREIIFGYCQNKPRDIISYCSLAIETAQSKGHSQIKIEDIQEARKRFSDTRLKDLGDEYSENYPQIQLVLSRFYGLGKRYTVTGVESFIQRLLVDDIVKTACAAWLFDYTAPESFIRLLYNIGFWGFVTKEEIIFRSLGPRSTIPAAITSSTEIAIHPSYSPALDLQDVVISSLDETVPITRPGLLIELPESITIGEYQNRLIQMENNLKTLPCGSPSAFDFEEIVGEMLKLCFYRWLHNVQPHQRDYEGRVVRDWIASNRAADGFWEMIRTRYDATQVVWECKNFEELTPECFHQMSYYLTNPIGRFGIIAFRGEIKKTYYGHLKRIAEDKKLILLLGQKDLLVFIRQARNGKIKEDHIQDRYDTIVRYIS